MTCGEKEEEKQRKIEIRVEYLDDCRAVYISAIFPCNNIGWSIRLLIT